ncbi:hypothetical protein D3C71_1398450 [compost metagenome]
MQEGAFARVVQEGVVQRLGGQHRRQGQEAAGQALGQAQQVRHHPGLLAGEQGAGTAKAGGDLVGDQEGAVGVAQFTGALQVHRVMHAHAAGALQARLQDHRADLARVLVEQGGQRVCGLVRTLRGALPGFGQVGVRRGRKQRLGQQRRVHPAVQRDIAHRQRAQGLAVVAVLQRDEARAVVFAAVAEIVEGHLQGHLHPGRAIVGVEHLGQRVASGLARGDRQQALGQQHRRFMAEPGQHHLLQLGGLPGDGRADARLRMAEQIGPPTAHRVQVALAVVIDQPRAFATGDRQQRQGVRVFTHLRARVPQHGQVACAPLVGQRQGGWVC